MPETTLPADAVPVAVIAREFDVHVSTVCRWCLRGVRGRRLRSALVGGKRFVRRSDRDDWIDWQGEPSGVDPSDDGPDHGTRHRDRPRCNI